MNPIQNPVQPIQAPPENATNPQNSPPVHFKNLVKENEATGQNDELERIYALTESLKSDLDAFKKQASEKEMAKEQEVRQLQDTMGTMRAENTQLREENESKPSMLDEYYEDVLEDPSSTRSLIDREKNPPSEIAIEGTLVVPKTMISRPVEFNLSSQGRRPVSLTANYKIHQRRSNLAVDWTHH